MQVFGPRTVSKRRPFRQNLISINFRLYQLIGSLVRRSTGVAGAGCITGLSDWCFLSILAPDNDARASIHPECTGGSARCQRRKFGLLSNGERDSP